MIKDYEKVRFFLFCHSYSGETIASSLKEKYKKRKLANAIKRLSQIMGFQNKSLEEFIILGQKLKSPYKKMPCELKIYLEVEKELLKLTEEKQDEYSTAREDYQNQLLFPAIERAAGNSLTDVKNDQKFNQKLEEKTKIFTTTYCKVAYKYKLPTIRIVPFLLRLIC